MNKPSEASTALVADGRLRLEYARATLRRLEENRIRLQVLSRFRDKYRSAGYVGRFLLDLAVEREVARELARRPLPEQPDAGALFAARGRNDP